ncbi:hypothetical protein KRMM14A1259_64860 [Krasilnikovia sp. MM14-A1259]
MWAVAGRCPAASVRATSAGLGCMGGYLRQAGRWAAGRTGGRQDGGQVGRGAMALVRFTLVR